jgi:hypothetical protein
MWEQPRGFGEVVHVQAAATGVVVESVRVWAAVLWPIVNEADGGGGLRWSELMVEVA